MPENDGEPTILDSDALLEAAMAETNALEPEGNPEPVVTEDTKEEVEENSEESGSGGEEPTETPPVEEPEAEEPEQEDPVDPFLASLEDRGLGTFKSQEAALESWKSLRTDYSRKNEDAALGRMYREGRLVPEQAVASQPVKEDQTEPEPTPYPVFDQKWNSILSLDEESGVVTGPAEDVARYREWEAFDRSVRQDPRNLYNHPAFKADITGMIRAEMEQVRSRENEDRVARDSEKEAHDFLAEHGEFVRANADDFDQLVYQRQMHPEDAVELMRLRAAKTESEAKGKVGESAKKKDLSRARQRDQRRAAAVSSPIHDETPIAEKSDAEILADAFEHAPEDVVMDLGSG